MFRRIHNIVNKNFRGKTYKLGKPKDLESINKEDVLQNKVWLWVWEAGLEGEFNEDWQVPLLGLDDIYDKFTEPIITLEIIGSNTIASGTYDSDKNVIFGIGIWENDEWKSTKDCSLEAPIKFKSLVKINGKAGEIFELKSKEKDEAYNI